MIISPFQIDVIQITQSLTTCWVSKRETHDGLCNLWSQNDYIGTLGSQNDPSVYSSLYSRSMRYKITQNPYRMLSFRETHDRLCNPRDLRMASSVMEWKWFFPSHSCETNQRKRKRKRKREKEKATTHSLTLFSLSLFSRPKTVNRWFHEDDDDTGILLLLLSLCSVRVLSTHKSRWRGSSSSSRRRRRRRRRRWWWFSLSLCRLSWGRI